MAERDLPSAELIRASVAFTLAAQLGFIGQLLSTLVATRALSKEQATELLNKLADTISLSIDLPGSDLQAVLKKPIEDHAEALRKLARDLCR